MKRANKNPETEFENLKSFMTEAIQTGDSVEDWNEAREEAKTFFSETLISRLDASAFIKEFQLYNSH